MLGFVASVTGMLGRLREAVESLRPPSRFEIDCPRIHYRESRRASSDFFSSHFLTNSPMILEASALVMSDGS